MRRGTREQWAERVERWRASGETAKAFAARERVNAGTLAWWSSLLRRAAPSPAGFIEVASVAALAAPGYIELVLRDEVRIRVSGNFDPSLLRRVLAALEAR